MEHYFTNNKNLKSEEKKIEVIIKDKKFVFITDNGVFSKKGLDFGTRLLLESLEDISGDVLDFGTGYGAIGIFISSYFKCNVDMIDINERSLKLATKNSLLNQVPTNVFKSDIYDKIDKLYDYIITNPPIRVGKKILYKILFDALHYLKPNGSLIFVINKDQGAKSLFNDLEKVYKVKIIAKSKGFYVISAKLY